MIALDTNILLRFLVQDDAAQGALATQIMENELTQEEPGYVTVVALLELDWVLRTQYEFSSAIAIDAIKGLMSSPNLVFENADAVELALDFEHGDLADNILHRVAQSKGCSKTVTFDKRFARLDGVKRLG
jgi:predicted nucleic-acid-binding protein